MATGWKILFIITTKGVGSNQLKPEEGGRKKKRTANRAERKGRNKKKGFSKWYSMLKTTLMLCSTVMSTYMTCFLEHIHFQIEGLLLIFQIRSHMSFKVWTKPQ